MRTWEWNKATGAERAVLRNGEYFRRALEDHLQQEGRGSAKDLAAEVGYKARSMISNIIGGNRIPDFKKAVLISNYFGVEFVEWMLAGRRMVEPARGLQQIENGNKEMVEAIGKVKKIFGAQDKKAQGLVMDVLSIAAAADLSGAPKHERRKKA